MTELRARVESALRDDIAPALRLDPAEIEVLDVSDGVAQVRLGGACAGSAGPVPAARPPS